MFTIEVFASIEGDALLEYISLAFNHDCYLVGLSGIPDFTMTLWNWTKAEKLCSIASGVLVYINELVLTTKMTLICIMSNFRTARLHYYLVKKLMFPLDLPHQDCFLSILVTCHCHCLLYRDWLIHGAKVPRIRG